MDSMCVLSIFCRVSETECSNRQISSAVLLLVIAAPTHRWEAGTFHVLPAWGVKLSGFMGIYLSERGLRSLKQRIEQSTQLMSCRAVSVGINHQQHLAARSLKHTRNLLLKSIRIRRSDVAEEKRNP